MSRAQIRAQLAEVGFDDARQADIVGGLSGGWKMKLELARAMLYQADLLLLDEVGFRVDLPVLRAPDFSYRSALSLQPTNHVRYFSCISWSERC